MSVKLFVSIVLFSLLIKTVISEVTAFAYAHASSHSHSPSGSKHDERGRLNLTERMEELKAHINAMKEKHLKHRMEMLNKHKNWGPQNNNRQHHKTSIPHKEVSELQVVEPVTTEAISTHLINSIQTKEAVTEQVISTITEQIFYSPEVEKSHNVEEPNYILTSSTPLPTEESTLATIIEMVTEKSTPAKPTITVTTAFSPTVTVTERSTVVTTVGTISTSGCTVGENSVASTTTEPYPFMNLSHLDPEEQTAAHDFSNLPVSPSNSKEDSSYDNFDIDIRDGEIGE